MNSHAAGPALLCGRMPRKLCTLAGTSHHGCEVTDACPSQPIPQVTGKTFTPLAEAPAAVKAMNGGKSELHLQTRGSKFVRYQECKVQELPEEVPQGSTPRTLTVQLRDALTRRVKAGDAVTVSGIFLPEPYAGPRSAMRATLLTATYVQAMAVTQNKQSYQVGDVCGTRRGRGAAVSRTP